MGMGDALLLDPLEVRELSMRLCDIAFDRQPEFLGGMYLPGLDGIDISTCMPASTKRGWQHQYGLLNDELRQFKLNPASKGRSPLRLFYSLHSVYPKVRQTIMPNTAFCWSLKDIDSLRSFSDWYGIDVIFHHILLDGINDTMAHVKRLVEVVSTTGMELRFLRYNECDNSPYKESSKFDEIVKYCAEHLPKIKYQVSAGSEIKAACGQFLCKTERA